MLLSDQDLTAALEDSTLTVRPLGVRAVQPASVDVRLYKQFRVFHNHRYGCIDPRERQEGLTELVEVADGEPFVLHPGEFVLGATLEIVRMSDAVAARLEGKSSLGRLGLVVHSTAGWVDPGFCGRVTLELSNVNTAPVRLWPGDPIGQLCVFRLSSPARHPYGSAGLGSRYQDQDVPTESRSWLRWADGPNLS